MKTSRPRRSRGQLQQDVTNYILKYKLNPENNGFSPSIREIARALGYESHMPVYHAVQLLDAKFNPKNPSTLIKLDEKGRIVVPWIEISLKVVPIQA